MSIRIWVSRHQTDELCLHHKPEAQMLNDKAMDMWLDVWKIQLFLSYHALTGLFEYGRPSTVS